jgi:hypothetical protein
MVITMPLSDRILASLSQRPEKDSWNLAGAYQHMLGALFKLEKDERDPYVIKDLAAVSIDISKDIQAILGVLSDIVKD